MSATERADSASVAPPSQLVVEGAPSERGSAGRLSSLCRYERVSRRLHRGECACTIDEVLHADHLARAHLEHMVQIGPSLLGRLRMHVDHDLVLGLGNDLRPAAAPHSHLVIEDALDLVAAPAIESRSIGLPDPKPNRM